MIEQRILALRSHPPGDKPLPLVVPGQRIEVSACPDCDFDPRRLFVQNGRAWQINDILIDDVTIFVEPWSTETWSISGALFGEIDDYVEHLARETKIARRLAWRRVPRGGQLKVVASYQGSDREPDGGEFRGACIGVVAEIGPCLSG